MRREPPRGDSQPDDPLVGGEWPIISHQFAVSTNRLPKQASCCEPLSAAGPIPYHLLVCPLSCALEAEGFAQWFA